MPMTKGLLLLATLHEFCLHMQTKKTCLRKNYGKGVISFFEANQGGFKKEFPKEPFRTAAIG
jgi:hypothetical protein